MKMSDDGPFLFGDIPSLDRFVVQLTSFPEPLKSYLLACFSDQTAKLLAGFQGGWHPLLEQSLIADLNGIVHGELIYDPKRFAHLKIPAKLRKRIASAIEGPDLKDLNRDLLLIVFRGT